MKCHARDYFTYRGDHAVSLCTRRAGHDGEHRDPLWKRSWPRVTGGSTPNPTEATGTNAPEVAS